MRKEYNFQICHTSCYSFLYRPSLQVKNIGNTRDDLEAWGIQLCIRRTKREDTFINGQMVVYCLARFESSTVGKQAFYFSNEGKGLSILFEIIMHLAYDFHCERSQISEKEWLFKRLFIMLTFSYPWCSTDSAWKLADRSTFNIPRVFICLRSLKTWCTRRSMIVVRCCRYPQCIIFHIAHRP